MDENMSEEKRAENPAEVERQDIAKRMRTDFDHEENSTSSNNSENNSNSNDCIDQSASTSSDSGLPASNAEPENNPNESNSEEASHLTDESSDREMNELGNEEFEEARYCTISSVEHIL